MRGVPSTDLACDLPHHNEVMSVLEPLSNRPLGERIRRDRRSDLEYLGIRAPVVRQAANRGFSFYSLSDAQILEIWDELWRGSRYAEVMALALEYYRPIVRRPATTPDIWPVLSEWHRRVENWAHADGLANLYSYLLERQHDDVYPILQGWNAAVDLWPRRLSLVSLIHYTGKNAVFLQPGDVLPLVTTCMADDRHYIQLAVGWVLREMMRAYPGEILAYIEQHAQELPPKAFSRAIERLEPGDKERLRSVRR